MCFASYKFFQILQLSRYRLRSYFTWLKNTKAKYVLRMVMLTVLSTFCVLVTNALFDVYHSKALYSYIGLIFYFYFTIVLVVYLYSMPRKIPLKMTGRMARLNVALFIFVSLVSFFITAISTEYLSFIKFGALCFVPLFTPLIVPFVHFFMFPLERGIRDFYLVKCEKKLKRFPKLIEIGITGSMGKTTTRYILSSLLSKKYKVCTAPYGFSTLSEMVNLIHNHLKDEDEILIVDIEPKYRGDMKLAYNLLKPKYDIITSLNEENIFRLRKSKNITKIKFSMIENFAKDGAIVFNGEDKNTLKLYKKCKTEKILVGDAGSIKAKNILCSNGKTTFDLVIDDKTYVVHTRVLGEYNVIDILLCVAMAKKLNLTDDQIVSAIEDLNPLPQHLKTYKVKDVTILDDTYSSDIREFDIALGILGNMGGRKIVITPGLVGYYKNVNIINYNLGKKIAHIADFVIIVSKVNFASLKKGLDKEKFGEDKIYQAETLKKAKLLMWEFLREGDSVLLENSLPDSYT